MDTEPVILYVEDDMLSRQVMEVLLVRLMKFRHVTVFENSEAFMERLAALPQKPTLIFLDIHMQPDDGFTLLQKLRSHESYQQTLIVALTASVMNEEVERLKKAGFNGVLAKPIDQNTFPGVITRVLNGEHVWSVS